MVRAIASRSRALLGPALDTLGRMSARQLVSRLGRRWRQRWLYPRLGARLYPTPAPLPRVALPDLPFDETAWRDEPERQGRTAELVAGRFTFLGLPPASLGSPVDWRRAPAGNRLWQYELHYGSWALDLARGVIDKPADRRSLDTLLHLLDDWMEHNPPGSSPAWEPYPVARRLVAWSRLPVILAREPGFGDFWRRRLEPSLRRQTRFLAHNLEHDVPNNHLLANYRALAWMGLACHVWPEAELWRRLGLAGLWREMDRQVLADGVHDERSTSYHAIVLMDLLETWCLARHRGLVEGSGELPSRVAPTLGRMLAVLAALRPADGQPWPMLNDSVPGYPLDPRQLLAAGAAQGLIEPTWASGVGGEGRYAAWLAAAGPGAPTGSDRETGAVESPRTVVLADAGWAIWRGGEELLLFDAGPLGPDRVLGHGHADTLGFELHWRGRPLLVDPGVVSYEAGTWRDRLRGTAAHNTVLVDERDQCHFWGPFRVAHPPRARLLRADDQVLEGEHDGYRRLAEPVIHRRQIRRPAPGVWEIDDRFTGRGVHRFDLGLQWASGARVETEERGARVCWDSGAIDLRVVTLEPAEGASLRLEEGAVATGWNAPRSAPRTVWSWCSEVPCGSLIRLEIV